MFQRKVTVEYITPNCSPDSTPKSCRIKWLDSFTLRNFTNDAVFDDALPLVDGMLEIGSHVPLDRLRTSMQDWFHRKGYLQKYEELRITLR
jgi:hypothetical protein